ncbi:helix-turn-helix domain-containing protein [Klebsiella pneumoniae]
MSDSRLLRSPSSRNLSSTEIPYQTRQKVADVIGVGVKTVYRYLPASVS